MTNRFIESEHNSRGEPSLRKKIRGKTYFWMGKFNRKNDSVLNHLVSVARKTGYSYHIEETPEMSMHYNVVTRYILWARERT